MDYTQPREVPEFCGDGTAGDARGGSPVNGKKSMERKREFQGGNKTGLLNFVKVSSFWYNLIIFKNTFCYDNGKICNYCATTQPV